MPLYIPTTRTSLSAGTDGNPDLSSGTITLTGDTYYDTVSWGVGHTGVIITGGYRLAVKNLDLRNAPVDAISRNGPNGGNSTGSAAGTGGPSLSSGTVGSAVGGGNGGAGGSAAGGTGTSISAQTANGGLGGLGSSTVGKGGTGASGAGGNGTGTAGIGGRGGRAGRVTLVPLTGTPVEHSDVNTEASAPVDTNGTAGVVLQVSLS